MLVSTTPPSRKQVALHPEGVDRNCFTAPAVVAEGVALHPEGVDRNLGISAEGLEQGVALHPEGVDRNKNTKEALHEVNSRPPPGGRG